MNQNIKRLGREIPIEDRVMDDEGRWVGKYPLRRMIADHMREEFARRRKAPIEMGSGSNRLSELFSSMISEDEYARIINKIRLGTREQAFYYRLFKEVGLTVPQTDDEDKRCDVCGYATVRGFCRMCGTAGGDQ